MNKGSIIIQDGKHTFHRTKLLLQSKALIIKRQRIKGKQKTIYLLRGFYMGHTDLHKLKEIMFKYFFLSKPRRNIVRM